MNTEQLKQAETGRTEHAGQVVDGSPRRTAEESMTTYKELAERLEKFAANCCIPDDENTPPREAAAILRSLDAQPQQASKPLSDADFAFNMLALMFDAYENGVTCYEDPEDEVGFIGYAYRLADDDFQNIATFLNRVRPVQSGIKERG